MLDRAYTLLLGAAFGQALELEKDNPEHGNLHARYQKALPIFGATLGATISYFAAVISAAAPASALLYDQGLFGLIPEETASSTLARGVALVAVIVSFFILLFVLNWLWLAYRENSGRAKRL